MGKLKIGIVGCGAIGSYIAKYCQKNLADKIEIVALCDNLEPKAEALVKGLTGKVRVLGLEKLVEASDLVVEAASKEAAASVAEKALARGKSLIIMSVGGILGRDDLFGLAEKKKARIFLPSGALSGLDALKGAAVGGIKSVVLTTKKPPKGLMGAPYLVKNNIDVEKISKETVIFEGSASEAIKGFPKNVNVAAVLSLAGIGAQKTKIKIVVSPSCEANIHELEVSGDFGVLRSRTENLAFPENPKTSFLAALSAVAMLKDIVGSIKIGT